MDEAMPSIPLDRRPTFAIMSLSIFAQPEFRRCSGTLLRKLGGFCKQMLSEATVLTSWSKWQQPGELERVGCCPARSRPVRQVLG
jgi:hypothetical protein